MPFYYTVLPRVTSTLSRKRTDTTHPANASSLSNCTNCSPTTSNFSIFVLLTGKSCLFPSISHHSSLFSFEFCFWKNLSSWAYKPELRGAQTYCACLFMPMLLRIHWQRCGDLFSETMLGLAGQPCILAAAALKQYCSTNSFALLLTLCPILLILPTNSQ